MSDLTDPRTPKRRWVSRTRIFIGTLVAALVAVAGAVGYQAYHHLTTTTVTAYFTSTLALYPGDKVEVLGVRVGSIDSVEPDGDKMKVVLHYDSAEKVLADAVASLLNPSLVASRTVRLSPAYTGGPTLRHGDVIPLERTQVPVEWDDLRGELAKIVTGLGPTPDQPKGPFGTAIESFADGLAGKGEQLNTTFQNLSEALSALNKGRGDLFSVIRNLALFVNTLRASDTQFEAFNSDFATFTDALNDSDQELAQGVQKFKQLLTTTQSFLDRYGEVATKDVANLAETTNAILAPEPRTGLENLLHVLPTFGANFANIYSPTNGALTAVPVVNNFANPMQLLCSTIQAGSRLGYQDTAELCAQYLAPILDAIKFNFPPFAANLFTTASTLPKYVTYSEDRLRPPPGFKDTTVPGIWARDTPFSHGNREPGWIVAEGMQGVQLQPATQNMLAPESLSELMGAARRRCLPKEASDVEGVDEIEPGSRSVGVFGRPRGAADQWLQFVAGVANVPLPGGPGSGAQHSTIYVQVPNTLALNVNSRVRVADVFVGTVSKIELRNWVATLTLDLDPGVALPVNATAKIGQTSILGSQHVELAAPPDPSPRPLVDGDTIPLAHSTSFPTTERTLASIATVLRGGGISNLESIQNEVSDVLGGRSDQLREFLGRLDTFTAELTAQQQDITRAIDSTKRLLAVVAANKDVVDQTLTDLPPLIDHFADKRDLFADATNALGRLSAVANQALTDSRADLQRNLDLLDRPLTQLGRAAPFVIGALKLMLTAPFNIDDVPKVVRGDYVNISGVFDFTLSSFDNALLTGTRFSGALRALEQAWGRDPATMIPDVLNTPNPADLPPERGE